MITFFSKKISLLWVHLSTARHIGLYRLLNTPRTNTKTRAQPLGSLHTETIFFKPF
jgi:hypothetical protein